MIYETIWILISVVWLTISIYICYLVFKYAKPIIKQLFSILKIDNLQNEIKKINEQTKNRKS